MRDRGWRLILEHHFSMQQIIDGEDALEHAGRYNPPAAIVGEENIFRVIYLSGSPRTAHQEMQGRADIRNHALFEFEYTLHNDFWIDLTDESIQREFGVILSELYEDWRSLNARNQLSKTQNIGINAYLDGRVEGLKVPSARDDGFNWVIFPDRLQQGSEIKIIGSQPASVEDSNNYSDIDTNKRHLNSNNSDSNSEDDNNTTRDELETAARELMGDFNVGSSDEAS